MKASMYAYAVTPIFYNEWYFHSCRTAVIFHASSMMLSAGIFLAFVFHIIKNCPFPGIIPFDVPVKGPDYKSNAKTVKEVDLLIETFLQANDDDRMHHCVMERCSKKDTLMNGDVFVVLVCNLNDFLLSYSNFDSRVLFQFMNTHCVMVSFIPLIKSCVVLF